MAKVTITFEDTDAGVEIRATSVPGFAAPDDDLTPQSEAQELSKHFLGLLNQELHDHEHCHENCSHEHHQVQV